MALIALFALGAANAAEAPKEVVRFGLSAVVVRENLDFYERWAAYLGQKIGRQVQFVQRRTYREAMELLQVGEHDFSWICSLPYVKYRDANVLGLMAVPVFQGEPVYRSYIIAHKYSAFRTIAELQGRVFAYADPDSNSGYIVPRQMLYDLGRDPDGFFRHTFFTYSHNETVEAVAEQVADGGAVDSYVWEYQNQRQPQLTAKTKVIHRSENYGFPPMVYRIGVDPDLRARMTDALLTMDKDTEGQAFLSELMLDRFVTAIPSLYDNVRAHVDRR